MKIIIYKLEKEKNNSFNQAYANFPNLGTGKDKWTGPCQIKEKDKTKEPF